MLAANMEKITSIIIGLESSTYIIYSPFSKAQPKSCLFYEIIFFALKPLPSPKSPKALLHPHLSRATSSSPICLGTVAKPVQCHTLPMTGPPTPFCLALWYRVPQFCFLWKGGWLIIRGKPRTVVELVVRTILPRHSRWKAPFVPQNLCLGTHNIKGWSQMRAHAGGQIPGDKKERVTEAQVPSSCSQI